MRAKIVPKRKGSGWLRVITVLLICLGLPASATAISYTPFQDTTGQQLNFDYVQFIGNGVGYASRWTPGQNGWAYDIYKSANHGATWLRVGFLDPGTTVGYEIFFFSDAIYYFTGSKFGVSINDGATWTDLSEELHRRLHGGRPWEIHSFARRQGSATSDAYALISGDRRGYLDDFVGSLWAGWSLTQLFGFEANNGDLLGTNGVVWFRVLNVVPYTWEMWAWSGGYWTSTALPADLKFDNGTPWTAWYAGNQITLTKPGIGTPGGQAVTYFLKDDIIPNGIVFYTHGNAGDEDGYNLYRSLAVGQSYYVSLNRGDKSRVKYASSGNAPYQTLVDGADDFLDLQADDSGRVYALRQGGSGQYWGVYDLAGSSPPDTGPVSFSENFENYLPWSPLAGQGGWTGDTIYINYGSFMSSVVLDGRWDTGIDEFATVRHSISNLNGQKKTTFSFDAWATTNQPISHNANIGLGSSTGNDWMVIWTPAEGPARGSGQWAFDARQICGDPNAYELIPGGYDQPVNMRIIVDGTAGQVYGTYQFGGTIRETNRYPVSAADIQRIDLVTMTVDFRSPTTSTAFGSRYIGCEFDNLQLQEN